jgi:hypothetical protein
MGFFITLIHYKSPHLKNNHISSFVSKSSIQVKSSTQVLREPIKPKPSTTVMPVNYEQPVNLPNKPLRAADIVVKTNIPVEEIAYSQPIAPQIAKKKLNNDTTIDDDFDLELELEQALEDEWNLDDDLSESNSSDVKPISSPKNSNDRNREFISAIDLAIEPEIETAQTLTQIVKTDLNPNTQGVSREGNAALNDINIRKTNIKTSSDSSELANKINEEIIAEAFANKANNELLIKQDLSEECDTDDLENSSSPKSKSIIAKILIGIGILVNLSLATVLPLQIFVLFEAVLAIIIAIIVLIRLVLKKTTEKTKVALIDKPKKIPKKAKKRKSASVELVKKAVDVKAVELTKNTDTDTDTSKKKKVKPSKELKKKQKSQDKTKETGDMKDLTKNERALLINRKQILSFINKDGFYNPLDVIDKNEVKRNLETKNPLLVGFVVSVASIVIIGVIIYMQVKFG